MDDCSRVKHYTDVENVIKTAEAQGIKRFFVTSMDEELKEKLEKDGYQITVGHIGIELEKKRN